MEFSDEQLEVNNEWLEQRETVIVDNVVLDSVLADSVGNVFWVAANTYAGTDGYENYVAYAAYHYDKRIGLLNTIVDDVSYSDCLAAMARFREGQR